MREWKVFLLLNSRNLFINDNMYLKLSFIILLFLSWNGFASAQNKPADEITLEANVVQIILNDEHRNGVDWGAIVSDFHTAVLKNDNDNEENDKKNRLSFGTVSQDDYAVLLDALDTVGQMSQYPQPPIKVIEGNASTLSFDKQNIHSDFSLLRLKSGDLSLQIMAHQGDETAESKTVIANNTTIVIGGIMNQEAITKTHKFPLLGDIPIVGLVFRNQGRLMQKTETIIFLTVRTHAVDVPEEDAST